MTILSFILGIFLTLLFIGANLTISDLKMDIESEKNHRKVLRSPFIKLLRINSNDNVYLNGLIMTKNKDYEMLFDGILFTEFLMEGDVVKVGNQVISIK